MLKAPKRKRLGAFVFACQGSIQPSTTSNPVVICAVLPSMMLAEQYLSWLMAMTGWTATQ